MLPLWMGWAPQQISPQQMQQPMLPGLQLLGQLLEVLAAMQMGRMSRASHTPVRSGS
jgi:hypothetical protein